MVEQNRTWASQQRQIKVLVTIASFDYLEFNCSNSNVFWRISSPHHRHQFIRSSDYLQNFKCCDFPLHFWTQFPIHRQSWLNQSCCGSISIWEKKHEHKIKLTESINGTCLHWSLTQLDNWTFAGHSSPGTSRSVSSSFGLSKWRWH